jgi:hypothetical protein
LDIDAAQFATDCHKLPQTDNSRQQSDEIKADMDDKGPQMIPQAMVIPDGHDP